MTLESGPRDFKEIFRRKTHLKLDNMEKILVPIESIEHHHTYSAVEKAIDLSAGKGDNAELIVLHVEYVEAALLGEEKERLIKAKKREIKEEFDIIKEACQEKGVSNIRTMIKEGKPDKEIVKLAKEEKIDLIVIGSGKLHDRSLKGHIERFFYGSVTEEVIHKAPCSILIVREPETGRE